MERPLREVIRICACFFLCKESIISHFFLCIFPNEYCFFFLDSFTYKREKQVLEPLGSLLRWQ